mmetsp:Transcript_41513/g.114292  ORF Transcript_41513/g.114292 Transcript_41513/m.114292 type:complete len:84 (-) Transcript_41513:583-834(-)
MWLKAKNALCDSTHSHTHTPKHPNTRTATDVACNGRTHPHAPRPLQVAPFQPSPNASTISREQLVFCVSSGSSVYVKGAFPNR